MYPDGIPFLQDHDAIDAGLEKLDGHTDADAESGADDGDLILGGPGPSRRPGSRGVR